MVKVRSRFATAVFAGLVCATNVPAWGASTDGDSEAQAPAALLDSNSSRVSRALSSDANRALLVDDFAKAEKLAYSAIAKDAENFDAHRIYAEALEVRYFRDDSRDRSLMLKCIEEWLVYMRAHAAEAGRIHFDGVGMSNFFPEHDSRYMLAQQHLRSLVGFAPHAWETNKHFLQRVHKKIGNLNMADSVK